MEVDFVSSVLDEIALEGLVGITITSLWIRLKERPCFCLSLDDQSKAFLWRAIKQQTSLEMYVLPKPRTVIVVESRDLYTDMDTGVCIEPATLPENIYPVKVVNEDGVRGSCPYYDIRENVTEKIRYSEISLADVSKEYGEKLVIVASQMLRSQALFGQSLDPHVDIPDLTYCVLERIARCRYEGDLMGTKECIRAFADYKLKHKDFFYHRKILFRFALIKKQTFVFRNVKNAVCRNTLAHLTRFYKPWKTRWHILVEKLCEKISQYPNNVCERKICNGLMGSDHNSLKRVMPFASPYLKLHKMRYADLYPDTPQDEHYNINGTVKLVTVVSIIKKFPPDSDEEEVDDASDKEEDKPSVEKLDESVTNSQWREENMPNERPFMQKVYESLEETGSVGMSLADIERQFNISRLEARGFVRSLQRLGLVADAVYKDSGRQRLGMFVAKGHFQANKINQEVSAEKSKLKLLYHGDVTKEDKGDTSDGIAKNRPIQLNTVLPDKATDEPDSEHDSSPSKLRLNSELPKPTRDMTQQNLKRVNIILSAVREAKLIENVHLLNKLIVAAEQNDPNVHGRVDRKSVLRLISRLSKAGQIRSIKTTLHSENRQKEVHFICDPSVRPNDPIVQCAIEQARLRYLTVPKVTCRQLIREKKEKKPKQQHSDSSMSKLPASIRASFLKLRGFRSRLDLQDMTYDPSAGRKYGFTQKFQRMQIVHKLLWYHAYGYKGTVPQSTDMKSLPSYFLGVPFYKYTTATKQGKAEGKEKTTPSAVKSNHPVVSPENKTSSDKLMKQKEVETDKEDITENTTSTKEAASCSDKVNQESFRASDISKTDSSNLNILEKDQNDAGDEVEQQVGGVETKNIPESYEPHGMSQDDKEPPVFLDEMSWRRYLPPLPKHKDYPEGWCLVSDVILCLPLTLFCQIINIPYQVSGLMEMLTDQKKQNYPLLAVPFHISQQLLHARKYVFVFHDILTQLCQVGLLSFGQQQHKEKEQIFIYVHKHASLYNTSTSLPGYMLTRPPTLKPFPRKQITFNTSDNVDQFWSELKDVCLLTNLGRHIDFKSTYSGTTCELPPDRLSLTDALKAHTPDTVRDDGNIPGDGLGAGGFDSKFFFHLFRNWSVNKVASDSWKNKLYVISSKDKKLSALRVMRAHQAAEEKGDNPALKFDESSTHVRLPRLVPHQKLNLGQTSTDKQEEVVKTTIVHGSKGNKGGKGIKRKASHPFIDKSPDVPKRMRTSVAKGRKKKIARIRKKDPRDMLARKQMQKCRVEWTPREDSLLLLTKVANLFLCGKRSGILVPWSKVRDVMHEAFEVSRDKTSYACQRRVSFAMKNPQTVLNVETFLAEALHDKSLVSEFRYRNYISTDPGAHSAFICLLKRLRDKFISRQYTERVSLPMTLTDLQRKYNVTAVGNRNPKRVFEEATTIQSIQTSVLRDVIHSFMSLGDKKGRSHEMYLLFSQYPDLLLTQVFTSMREDRMITRLKREYKSKVLRFKQILPVNAHHLAQGYFNMMLCRMPQNVFEQALNKIAELYQNSKDGQDPVDYEVTEGGHAAVIVNLLAIKKIKLSMLVPDQILVLDKVSKPQRTKKAKVHLKYLEQKKKDREEDEDIELFEKSHPDSDLSGKKKSDSSTVVENAAELMSHDGGSLVQTQKEGLVSLVIQEAGTLGWMHDSVSSAENMPSTSSSKPTVTREGGYMTVESDTMSYTVPTDMASRYTLSLLRNQCIDTTEIGKSNPQDWFLIKACDIKASLTNISLVNKKGEEQTQEVPLFLSDDKMTKIIKSLLVNHPTSFKESEEWESLSDRLLPDDQLRCKQIYRYVNESGQYGIEEHELFMKSSQGLQHVDFKYLLKNLQEHHLVPEEDFDYLFNNCRLINALIKGDNHFKGGHLRTFSKL